MASIKRFEQTGEISFVSLLKIAEVLDEKNGFLELFTTKEYQSIQEVISAGGLLETSHRVPNLDYEILMKLTAILTNNYRQSEEMYRRMCFNVFAHNRDDHAKNFSFLYEEESGEWVLSPAYDLTYFHSIGGEHATTVGGNGINPRE